MNDLKEHLRAMAGMLAEERRDTAEAICLEAAAEIERMRAAMIHQQMSLADTEALCLSHEAEIERLRDELTGLTQHYTAVCRENRPSAMLHDAAISEKDAEIERLRAERDLWKRRYERLDPKPNIEAEEQW